jgi:hypothetical protein
VLAFHKYVVVYLGPLRSWEIVELSSSRRTALHKMSYMKFQFSAYNE